MCKKKEELTKEIMRLEHNVNVMNERLNNQANAIKHYEQESRNKAIDEFKESVEINIIDLFVSDEEYGTAMMMLQTIAEQMKGV